MPKLLRELYDGGRPEDWSPPSIFLIGHSDQAGEFRAYSFSADQDFEAHRAEGMFIIPTPFAYRPSDIEVRELRAENAEDDDAREIVETWTQKPALPVPSAPENWIAAAMLARHDRTTQEDLARPWARVIVDGPLMFSRIQRGSMSTFQIDAFDDSDEDFARMVRGSLHPVSQRGPCLCESGKPYLECCLAEHRDEPCDCGSGKTLAECCMLAGRENV